MLGIICIVRISVFRSTGIRCIKPGHCSHSAGVGNGGTELTAEDHPRQCGKSVPEVKSAAIKPIYLKIPIFVPRFETTLFA